MTYEDEIKPCREHLKVLKTIIQSKNSKLEKMTNRILELQDNIKEIEILNANPKYTQSNIMYTTPEFYIEGCSMCGVDIDHTNPNYGLCGHLANEDLV